MRRFQGLGHNKFSITPEEERLRMIRLRQEMEKLRLLIDSVRRRETLKRDFVKYYCEEKESELELHKSKGKYLEAKQVLEERGYKINKKSPTKNPKTSPAPKKQEKPTTSSHKKSTTSTKAEKQEEEQEEEDVDVVGISFEDEEISEPPKAVEVDRRKTPIYERPVIALSLRRKKRPKNIFIIQ